MKEFKPLSKFEKIKLKYTDRKAYLRYKKELRFFNGLPLVPNLNFPSKQNYTFKHSGNAGDIIYALPACLAIANDATITLYLKPNVKADYEDFVHPLGDVMLNEKMIELLKPLLLHQNKIANIVTDSTSNYDVDLDVFRQMNILLDRGNICHWYFLTFGITRNLSEPWLKVTPNNNYNDTIILARSSRYNQIGIDYSFLKKYPNLLFVGVESEYLKMKESIPSLLYQPVENFLQLAEIIAGSKFFIGNQSFPFSIAEALKVKRILEVYSEAPNVIPDGENGYEFYYQPQFEHLVNKLNNL